jgi:hypothetical protein
MPLALIASGLIGGLLLMFSGGGSPGPGPDLSDAVSEVFDTQEAAFRKWSPERAKALRAGKIKTEDESRKWMEERFLLESDAAWVKFLEAEAAVFGGEKWTAEKEAATIERYAR